jgi:hypothetical protein
VKKSKKRYLFLLEFVVGCCLLSLILSLFFVYEKNNMILIKKSERNLEISSSLRSCYERVNTIFSTVCFDKKHVYFSSTENEMELHFDNGIVADPSLSGLVRGKLFFLDKKLKLKISSISDTSKVFEEVLIDNIEGISFSYFSPETGELIAWKDTGTLPLLMYLTLNLKESTSTCLAFELRRSWKRELPKVA